MKNLRPWRRTGILKECEVCGTTFYVVRSSIKKRKYCSQKCYGISEKGKPMHENTKRALEKIIPWNKGLKASEDNRVLKNIEAAHKGWRKKSPVPWNKGKRWGKSAWIRRYDNNRYRNIHKKIYKLFGSPNTCQQCGVKGDNRKIHWANASSRYTLERNDWLRLCVSCHIRHDGSAIKKEYYEKTQ